MARENIQDGILLVHPTGNTFSRAAAEAFHCNGLLYAFHTCLAVGKDSGNSLAQKLYKQRAVDVPEQLIHTQPIRELGRLLTQKYGLLNFLRTHERGAFSVDQVYRALDHKVARFVEQLPTDELAAVYAYEDGALASFGAARRKGIRSIYDLPIGYWRAAKRIQEEEAEIRPDWRETMPALIDSDEKLQRKDEELRNADHIIVASQFTARTLKEAPFAIPEPFVVPYGCPPARESTNASNVSSGKLRALYVGSLSQRKGLADLLDAVELVYDAVDLTLIGRRVGECRPLDVALERHNWIESLPHGEILQQMQQHDVLVFPSLFEGFGLVITEALSQGMPVIASTNTCAPDIIVDGEEGFIIPIRSSQIIAERLLTIHRDRELLKAMRQKALIRAQSMSWNLYQSQLIEGIKNALGK